MKKPLEFAYKAVQALYTGNNSGDFNAQFVPKMLKFLKCLKLYKSNIMN